MIIIKANDNHLVDIMNIVHQAKKYLKDLNVNQWQDGYPNIESFYDDIKSNSLYVVKNENNIIAVFALKEHEVNYDYIYDGKWGLNDDYIAVHRFAVDNIWKGKGVAKYIFDYIKSQYAYIRIDTHPDNSAMINCLYKNGFVYRGKIYLDKSKINLRNAYDFIK